VPPTNEPDIPPDIPPEYVDAYLAGFQRGYGGEVEPLKREPIQVAPEPEPAEADPEPELVEDESEPVEAEPEPEPEPVEAEPEPATRSEPVTAGSTPATPKSGTRGRDKAERPDTTEADLPTGEGDQRQADMEWLFERDKDVPLGWAFDPADEPTRGPGSGESGSTSTTAQPPAWRDEGRTGRSPWMVFAVFVAILLLLMLVSYIGGMAFSTIVNR
jgi:hypothetical protein